MAEYRIVLKDTGGYEIASDRVDGLRAAKERARYFLSDAYAKQAETTHACLDTWKVEVLRGLDCVWDAFK